MSSTHLWRLLPLAPFALLLACSDSRDLPSAPGSSITADRSATRRLDVPSPRGYPLMGFDPVQDQVYLVGGFYNAGFDAEIFDLWRFNPRSRQWTQLADVLPPKNGDAVALDVQSRRLIEFQPYGVPVETWAYDIETGGWENRQPVIQPPARWGSMAVYDPRADRVLVYGGGDLNTGAGLGDLWAYDYESNTWTERHPSVSPPPHHFTALVYVPTIDRTILFGGYDLDDGSLYNDMWAYDYHRNRWTNLHPKSPPAPRLYHYMGFEPATNHLVMFGGVLDESDPNEPVTNETWIYDVAANRWSQAFPRESPSPRAWHVISRTNGPVVLFGGGPTRDSYTNDTFLYDSRRNTWRKVGEEDGPHP